MAYWVSESRVLGLAHVLKAIHEAVTSGQSVVITPPPGWLVSAYRHQIRQAMASAEALPHLLEGRYKDLRYMAIVKTKGTNLVAEPSPEMHRVLKGETATNFHAASLVIDETDPDLIEAMAQSVSSGVITMNDVPLKDRARVAKLAIEQGFELPVPKPEKRSSFVDFLRDKGYGETKDSK